MRPKEFSALVSLLEDPDEEVFGAIHHKLIEEGVTLVPLLERAWETSESLLLQKRVEAIVHKIQFSNTQDSLLEWVRHGCVDLLKGAVYVARYQYPDVEFEVIDNQIDKIKQKVWLELNESLTALEKVKVLNHILFGVYKYVGNTTNFFAPQNHFINQLIETKKGGVVLLSIFYSVIAQKLGLPIFGVSLPRNYLLAYIDRYQPSQPEKSNGQKVLFYINPFNQGSVLGRKEIEHFLEQNKIPAKNEYFVPCDNCIAISQLIGSLMISYQKTGSSSKVDDLKIFLDILKKTEGY